MAAEAHNIVAINPSSLHIVYLWHDAGRVRTCPPGKLPARKLFLPQKRAPNSYGMCPEVYIHDMLRKVIIEEKNSRRLRPLDPPYGSALRASREGV